MNIVLDLSLVYVSGVSEFGAPPVGVCLQLMRFVCSSTRISRRRQTR